MNLVNKKFDIVLPRKVVIELISAIEYQYDRIWSNIEGVVKKRPCLNSKTAIVSFTFDDAPISSFTTGGRILEDYGFRGTYYVSAGLLNRETEVGRIANYQNIKEFQRRGHEIANHTYTHINCAEKSPIGVIRNIMKNRKKLYGIDSGNFAYPYGSINVGARIAASLFTTSARGTGSGINRDLVDLVNLKAVRIYDRLGIEKCLDLIFECAAKGGWLIFYTHDVDKKPSDYGCTPDQLTKVVKAVIKNKINVFPVQKAIETILGLQM